MVQVFTAEQLQKAKKNLVARKRTVTRGGKTYTQTVWVSPEKEHSKAGEHPASEPKKVTSTGKERKQREQRTPKGMSREEARQIAEDVRASVVATRERMKDSQTLRAAAIRRAIPSHLRDADTELHRIASGEEGFDEKKAAKKVAKWYRENYSELPNLEGMGKKKREATYRDFLANVEIGKLMEDVGRGRL